MQFEQLWNLGLLGLLPLVWWLRRRGFGKPAALWFPELSSLRQAFRGGRRPGSGGRAWLRLAVLLLAIIAAAGPKQLLKARQVSGEGIDIMLAVDISGSMLARDFDPFTRLQAAKAVAREFVAQAQPHRIGLVAFAAQPYVVCPLTQDYNSLISLMEPLQTGMVRDGTAIGMALAAALNRLKTSEAKAKIVLALTDGRNNAGAISPETAAEMAFALGIRIYTIGMGAREGGPIVVKDPAKGEIVVMNDDGSMHTEELDEAVLQAVALRTGGVYYRAEDARKLKLIFEEIRGLEETQLQSKVYQPARDWGSWLAAGAAVLLLLEIGFQLFVARQVPG